MPKALKTILIIGSGLVVAYLLDLLICLKYPDAKHWVFIAGSVVWVMIYISRHRQPLQINTDQHDISQPCEVVAADAQSQDEQELLYRLRHRNSRNVIHKLTLEELEQWAKDGKIDGMDEIWIPEEKTWSFAKNTEMPFLRNSFTSNVCTSPKSNEQGNALPKKRRLGWGGLVFWVFVAVLIIPQVVNGRVNLFVALGAGLALTIGLCVKKWYVRCRIIKCPTCGCEMRKGNNCCAGCGGKLTPDSDGV